ncbi:MAG: PEP-CTERM sorting domain-containing protein [Candidatus Anammoxibacter sp.]
MRMTPSLLFMCYLVVGILVGGKVYATSISWDPQVVIGKSSSVFYDATMTFAPVQADMVSWNTVGSFIRYSDHDEGFFHVEVDTHFTLSLRNNGIWKKIWADTKTDGWNGFLSGPISFTSGIITGMRLSSDGNVGDRQGTQVGGVYWYGGEGRFNLTTTVTPVPEPATVALMGIGIVGLVGAGYRKRRKNKSTSKMLSCC